MKKLLVGFSALLLIVLVGCGSAPQQQIDAARAALEVAKNTGAEQYAPEAFKAAIDKDAELKAELTAQDSNFFKSYDKATQLTTELQQLADKAKTDAVAGKEKAKADAQAAITAVEAAITAGREALKTAPKGKGNAADLAAMTGDLDAAAKQVEEAKADLVGDKFIEAKTIADSAKAKADKVKADIDAAKELKKGVKK